MFRGIMLRQTDSGVTPALEVLAEEALPAGDVQIAVQYSSLNYKDAMPLTGKAEFVRTFPMIPGLDLAGVVERSTAPELPVGTPVVVTGWGLGASHWGGLAEKARVPADWVVPLPEGLTPLQAMAAGTAGLAAMLCVMALEEGGLRPGDGPVLVTGAGGGVGSLAVAILSKLGHEVVASSQRAETEGYLRSLGARAVIGRIEPVPGHLHMLGEERWAGAVDVVGGPGLAGVMRQMRYGASVAVTGFAGGMEFATSMLPLVGLGVSLRGVNTSRCPQERRLAAWRRLAQDLPREALAAMTQVIPLAQVIPASHEVVGGRVQGRLVVAVTE
ncbi:MAG TPA: MDR family oxidoreductase [Symbiobacteriaceae bacterium]|nr:MDR family oxidoreductase [Symbiobacteriaceae bacterium]